ncbi:MAG: hypothetical protein ACLFVO_00910 [Chloroflexaceae bacterium]
MKTLLIAARRPLALAVLVVAVLTGLTIVNWMLPLGIAVYVVAVLLASRDSNLVVEAQRSASMSHYTSAAFRTIIEEIDRSQREVERSAAQGGGPMKKLFDSIIAQTQELVQQAHELARKGQIIEQYQATINFSQLQGQIDQIDNQIARTTDDYTLQQLQGTRQALVSRQQNAQALETYVGRIHAQLQNIDANLDNVHAEVIRLRTADMVSVDSASNQVAQRLSDLNADMDAFQQVLDTALVQSGATA